MQLAIFLVLVLIAVILAPWLIGVLIATAAAYGVWLVALAIATLIVGLLVFGWHVLTGKTEGARERRIAKLVEKSNEHYRQKNK